MHSRANLKTTLIQVLTTVCLALIGVTAATDCPAIRCGSCQECQVGQVMSSGPCSSTTNGSWPAPPSDIEVQIKYGDSTEMYITLSPPSTTLDLVEGFRVELLWLINTGRQIVCLTKRIDSCKLTPTSVIGFCYEPTIQGLVSSIASSLPPPPGSLEQQNSVSYTTQVRTRPPDGPGSPVPFSHKVFIGNHGDGASIIVTFKATWPSYRVSLSLFSNNSQVNYEYMKDTITVAVGENVTKTFDSLCGGSYKVKIQALKTDKCPCRTQRSCQPCAAMASARPIVIHTPGCACNNTNAACIPIPAETPPKPRSSTERDNKLAPGALAAIIASIGGVFIICVCATFILIVVKCKKKRTGNNNEREAGDIGPTDDLQDGDSCARTDAGESASESTEGVTEITGLGQPNGTIQSADDASHALGNQSRVGPAQSTDQFDVVPQWPTDDASQALGNQSMIVHPGDQSMAVPSGDKSNSVQPIVANRYISTIQIALSPTITQPTQEETQTHISSDLNYETETEVSISTVGSLSNDSFVPNGHVAAPAIGVRILDN